MAKRLSPISNLDSESCLNLSLTVLIKHHSRHVNLPMPPLGSLPTVTLKAYLSLVAPSRPQSFVLFKTLLQYIIQNKQKGFEIFYFYF